MHSTPQVLAAKFRHQPDHQARAAYWIDLDERYRDFQAKFPNRSPVELKSCERAAPDILHGRGGYRPSTLKTWLRDWQSGSEERQGSTIDRDAT